MTSEATTDDAAFLRAILAEPDADLPRLVYADWLDERGQGERAEFIRVQCELAAYQQRHRPQATDEWWEAAYRQDASCSCPACTLRRRERELLTRNWDGWHYEGQLTGAMFCENLHADTQPCPTPWIRFRRGFVSGVALPWDGRGWLDNWQAILDSCPTRNAKDGMVRLTTWPEVELVRYDGSGPMAVIAGCRYRYQPSSSEARADMARHILAAEWPGVRLMPPSVISASWDDVPPVADLAARLASITGLARENARPGEAAESVTAFNAAMRRLTH